MTPTSNTGGGVGYNSFPLEIIDDSIPELDEAFLLELRVAAAFQDSATVIIIDDDNAPGSFDPDYNPDYDANTAYSSFNETPGANAEVLGVAVQSDGKSLIGGEFTAVNSLVRNRIARMNVDGSLDTTFQTGVGANDFVSSVAISPTLDANNPNPILIAGGFTSFNGVNRSRVARLRTDGSLDDTFNPGLGADGPACETWWYTDPAPSLGGPSWWRFLQLRWHEPQPHRAIEHQRHARRCFRTPGTGANGAIHTVAIQKDGKLLIGGEFTEFNGVARNRIARLTASGAVDTTFNPSAGANGTVFAIALDDRLGGQTVSTNLNREASGGQAEDIQDIVILPPGTPVGAVVSAP